MIDLQTNSSHFLDKGDIIGLARDGHIVYNSKNSEGNPWLCSDHDVCNGMFFSEGHYAYVSTDTHINCWGPSTNPNSCNERNCIGPFQSQFLAQFNYHITQLFTWIIIGSLALLIVLIVALCKVCKVCKQRKRL